MSDTSDTRESAATVSGLGWGILATGGIADTFARDLAETPGHRVAAAGSRTQGSADAFCARHGGRAHGSYAELVQDPDVEVVYVASPHAFHAEHVRLALDAGKPVLCEKPLTLTEQDTAALLAEARERGVFLMEAMWTACHPLVRETVRRVRAGEFGTVRQVRAGLGFPVPADPDSRMLDPELGASAVLDMGIYPLTLAHLLLGEPDEVRAAADVDDRGVDLDTAMSLRWSDGAVAALTCSMTSHAARDALVSTDTGQIRFAAPFHHPPRVTWHDLRDAGNDSPDRGEGVEVVAEEAVVGRGYGNEALEVARCLDQGLLESPLVPHEQTVALARVMDRVLAQVGALGR